MKRKETYTFYNFQFKHTAVSITNHPNILSVDAAEALRWRQEMREGILENNNQEARSRNKLIQAENKIKKLESELKHVRAENNVLKKAERLFPGKK